MATVLGYWKASGLAHQIRMVLKYKEVDFENRMYQQGSAPDFSREEWLKEKFTLGLEIPNLPYLIDGDVKVTETMAILQYLGRKYNMLGSTSDAMIRNDMAYSLATELRVMLGVAVYSPEFEKYRPMVAQSLPERLEKISKFLSGRKFFAGDEVTISDFAAYDVLDILRNFEPGCVTQDNLKEFITRIEALPTIKAYIESGEYLRKPFYSAKAKWGGEQ